MNPKAPPPLLCAFLLFFFFPLLSFSVTCPSSCANFHNISYPFGATSYCGYPGFLLSNCDSTTAQWTPYLDTSALLSQRSYVVDTIDNDRTQGTVSVTWPMGSNCTVFNSSDSSLNGTLFAGTNLSVFMAANLSYSEGDIFLLFDCSGATDSGNDQYCSSFANTCSSLETTDNQSIPMPNCVSFKPTNRTDMGTELKQALDNCTFYRSVVTSQSPPSNSNAIELTWTLPPINNSQCAACEKSNGSCGFLSGQMGFPFVCYCDKNISTRTDCWPPGCSSVSCNKGKLIAVIVLPTVAFFSISLVVACFVRRRRKDFWRTASGGSSHRFVTERGKSFAAQFGPVAAREFSFKELADATQSFSNDRLIGDGGFGAVYQGMLYDDRQVAVKRLYHDNFRRMEQFYNEIKILSSLRHSNLVKLYGYCCEDDRDLLLVFEYVSNGTVADHLHNQNAEAMPWKIRLKIALETAEALSYLHNVSPPIYHRDVKSANILLEQDFRVKLADFGLSRLVPLQATHVSTLPQGTPGYLDPDYHQSYQLTDKSDVYSFGVVLVELISALPAVDISRSRGQINLSSLAVSKIVGGAWHELVDSRLEIDREPHVAAMVRNVSELAFRCLNAEKENRPDIKEVVQELSIITESGYGEFKSELSINVSFDTKESSRLINDNVSSSSTSDQSSMLSSNASLNSSSLCISSRGSLP